MLRKWVHHVGGISLNYATVTYGGAQFSRGEYTRGFTGAQGTGVIDRTAMFGVALDDVVVKLGRACRTEAGHAAGGRVLHAGVGL